MNRVRTFMVVLLILVVALVTISSADAAKKKKKKPKPWTSEDVQLRVAHGVFYGASGRVLSVTAMEFEEACATPTTNGLDAYVFEVPPAYQSINAFVDAKVTASVTGMYDLDLFMYSKDCVITFSDQDVGTDESGVILKGTAWILLHNFEGEPNVTAHIGLKPM